MGLQILMISLISFQKLPWMTPVLRVSKLFIISLDEADNFIIKYSLVISEKYVSMIDSTALIQELKHILVTIQGKCRSFQIWETNFTGRFDLLRDIINSIVKCNTITSLSIKDCKIPIETDQNLGVRVPLSYNGHIRYFALEGWGLNEQHQNVIMHLVFTLKGLQILDLSKNRFWNIRDISLELRHIKQILFKGNLIDLDQSQPALNAVY